MVILVLKSSAKGTYEVKFGGTSYRPPRGTTILEVKVDPTEPHFSNPEGVRRLMSKVEGMAQSISDLKRRLVDAEHDLHKAEEATRHKSRRRSRSRSPLRSRRDGSRRDDSRRDGSRRDDSQHERRRRRSKSLDRDLRRPPARLDHRPRRVLGALQNKPELYERGDSGQYCDGDEYLDESNPEDESKKPTKDWRGYC